MTSLTAEADSFFSSTLLVPEGTVRPWGFPGATDTHAVSTVTVAGRLSSTHTVSVSEGCDNNVGPAARAPIPLMAKTASALGAL